VASSVAFEPRSLRESKRLRQQANGPRSTTNDSHGFGVTFDHDFGTSAHACQQRWKVAGDFGLGEVDRALAHTLNDRCRLRAVLPDARILTPARTDRDPVRRQDRSSSFGGILS